MKRVKQVHHKNSVKQLVLTSIFVKLRDKLRVFASGITGSEENADDVLHDAFCKLWSRQIEINSELEAIKLSYTVVRNTAIDQLRNLKNHTMIPLDNLPEIDSPVESEQEENALLYKALLALSRKILKGNAYEIFILHDVENLSYQEIANRLNLSQENVRQILSRSRKKIRDAYRSGTSH